MYKKVVKPIAIDTQKLFCSGKEAMRMLSIKDIRTFKKVMPYLNCYRNGNGKLIVRIGSIERGYLNYLKVKCKKL